MNDIKFYELIFDNEDEGMCIKGTRCPTPKEATAFVKKELETIYDSTKVVSVGEISKEEADAFFDTSRVDEWPVFA